MRVRTSSRFVYPFSAIVGQERLKKALLVNAVYPGIGGLLVSGKRGTAKSTAARALAALLPMIRVVHGCNFYCDPDQTEGFCSDCMERISKGQTLVASERPMPFVSLPLGATEDRVLGALDMERAIKSGERIFEPGLLARANRGILYIDEVNLLADHLVDVLLDVVAMGVNRVEREGISYQHPAEVILVGTMNPEEGDLRPQLLDRFGLFLEMDQEYDPGLRAEVIKRRTRFDEVPEAFLSEWKEADHEIAHQQKIARGLLPEVKISDGVLIQIAQICAEHRVDGMRADIVIHKTARALAALAGRREVDEKDIDLAASFALGHRSHRRPEPDPGSPPPSQTGVPPQGQGFRQEDSQGRWDRSHGADPRHDRHDNRLGAEENHVGDETYPVEGSISLPKAQESLARMVPFSSGVGRRSNRVTQLRRGKYIRAAMPVGRMKDPALDAILRQAAVHQVWRQRPGYRHEKKNQMIEIEFSDFREKVRKDRVQHLIVFVVDASGSMGAYRRMAMAKGAVCSLLENAYQKRDSVSLIGFRKNGAEVLLSPTRSPVQAARKLVDLPTGGRTPLGSGLKAALDLVRREGLRHSCLVPLLVLLSDGRANVSGSDRAPMEDACHWADLIARRKLQTICIDTETGFTRLGLVRVLSRRMGGRYYALEDVQTKQLAQWVQQELGEARRLYG